MKNLTKIDKFFKNVIIVCGISAITAQLVHKSYNDQINYKSASFVYNDYIDAQKALIDSMQNKLNDFGDTASYNEYCDAFHAYEEQLDEIYSKNVRIWK